MWRPATVVPEHRNRATAIWGSLLLTIVGYTVWQIVTLHGKYYNPSTNFSVSDDVYPYPTLDVCVWAGQGCDGALFNSACIESAVYKVSDPCGIEIVESLTIDSKGTNCLALDLSKVELEGYEDCSVSKRPSVHVFMYWTTSIVPDEETTYTETVGLFLANETKPEYLEVPYSRVVITPGVTGESVTYVVTDMAIGKSTRNTIKGDSVTNFPVLSYTTTNFVDQDTPARAGVTDDDSTFARGYLNLILTQGSYSLTELSDINPLDAGAFLGNIGGFWELLLVIWGIFFIAARTDSPTQKGRDFAQSIQRGKEIVGRKRRRTAANTSTASPDSGGHAEEQPYYNATARGQQEAPASSVGAITPVGASPSITVRHSPFRRPVVQDYPRRSFSPRIYPVDTSESSFATSNRTPPRLPSELPRNDECI